MSLDKNKDETIESIAALLLKLTTGYQNKHANKAKLVKLLTQHYEQYGGTSKVIDDCNKLLAKNNNKYFPHIWKHYYSKRTGIFSFLESVHLDCIKQDKPLLQAVKLVVKFRKSKQNKEWIELGKEIDLSFVPKDWKKLIAKKDNKTINTRYFEVCVMMQLREKLSTSDIYIKGADAYGDYRKTFMPWSECATLLKEFCDASEIPNTAKKMVSFLKKELKTKAKSVDKAYPNLNELVIGDNGIPVLKKRQATKNPRAKSLREEIKSRMPERNLLDIMCLAQNCTDWAYCLSPLSGSSAKLSDLNSSHKCITH